MEDEKSNPPIWDSNDPEGSLERAADWVHDEVDRLREKKGLPPLGRIWSKPPCSLCDGAGYVPIGRDAAGYHWVRRCPWCNPDPPQGQAGE